MNIMFVGGGRRVSLARRFILAGFSIYAYETDKNAPISEIATIIEGKKWDDKDIEQHILDAFLYDNIDLAIPLQDAATVVLSRIKDRTNTKIPTANEEINNICLDKKLFANEFSDEVFYPNLTGDGNEKVIVKPRFGFNSRGIKVMYASDLVSLDENYIVQKYIDSGYEISVDAYFNKCGKMVDAVPRKRIEVQGGEVSKSITLDRNAFNTVEITGCVGERIGLVGPVCVQFIIENNFAYIMEVNARCGGGVILSLEAGFNIVDLIKREYMKNEIIKPKEYNWKVGKQMTRYFQEHFYE